MTKKVFVPDANGIRYLGSSTRRYAGVYSYAFHEIVVAPSDDSLKKGIVPTARGGLKDVDALQVMDFAWKADGRSDTGLIAQQVREVNPAFYHESADMIGHVAQHPLIKALEKSV